MNTLGPCNVSSFVAQSHTPCNRCVRFAAAVASDHATLATKRTLLLTWAGLAPAGSHQLCLAHLFDHLVGAAAQRQSIFSPLLAMVEASMSPPSAATEPASALRPPAGHVSSVGSAEALHLWLSQPVQSSCR